jgi:ABC-type dipeptide/oligopeptide/nickel transport system permease component
VWIYLLRRLLAGLIVMLVLSVGVFTLVALSGNPLAALKATLGFRRQRYRPPRRNCT